MVLMLSMILVLFIDQCLNVWLDRQDMDVRWSASVYNLL